MAIVCTLDWLDSLHKFFYFPCYSEYPKADLAGQVTQDRSIDPGSDDGDKRAGVKVLLMLFLITLGLVLILTKIILEQNTVDQPGWEKTLIELIGHLGIGAIILGVLSILLGLRHWTEYFKERLVDIVMEKSYMDRLTEPALLELQTDVLKSYFKNDTYRG